MRTKRGGGRPCRGDKGNIFGIVPPKGLMVVE